MRKTVILVLFLFAVIAIIIIATQKSPPNPVNIPVPTQTPVVLSTPFVASPSATFGIQTKSTGCLLNGPLPDPACTPGAIFPNATKEQICISGYSSSVRDVTQATKNKVFIEYGLPPTNHQPGEYEVDHFISLELGGSNDISNLFPEAASPKPGFHEKDSVENYLHNQLCKGQITLQQAQIEISTNWLQIYNQISGTP